MYMRMNGIYLGLFLMGFFWAFFFQDIFFYLRHIENTKPVEFASVAICCKVDPPFWLKMTGLYFLRQCLYNEELTTLIWSSRKTVVVW